MLTEEQLESALNKAVAHGYVSNAFAVSKFLREAMSEPQPADTQEGIPLQIDPRWKWAAMDQSENWYAYESTPEVLQNETQWNNSGGTYSPLNSLVTPPEPAKDWRDSLHEIRNGILVKYVDIPADGEPVMVRDFNGYPWKPRYSTGKLSAGALVCYSDGLAKFTTGQTSPYAWAYWRRPTQEELNQ